MDDKNFSIVKESIRRLYQANKEKEKFDRYYEAVKKKEQIIISNYFYACLPKEQKTLSVTLDEGKDFYENHKHINVSPICRRKIIWDIKKLKENLDKEICSRIIEKEYRIVDMPGLAEYLKSCGVKYKVFKRYIEVDEKVNNEEIDHLSEVGDIVESDIKDCYTVEVSDAYIRIKEDERGNK